MNSAQPLPERNHRVWLAGQRGTLVRITKFTVGQDPNEKPGSAAFLEDLSKMLHFSESSFLHLQGEDDSGLPGVLWGLSRRLLLYAGWEDVVLGDAGPDPLGHDAAMPNVPVSLPAPPCSAAATPQPHVHPVSHPVSTPCATLVPTLLPGAVDQESMPVRAARSVVLCI